MNTNQGPARNEPKGQNEEETRQKTRQKRGYWAQHIHSTLPDFPVRARFTGLRRLESRIYTYTTWIQGELRVYSYGRRFQRLRTEGECWSSALSPMD